jgi:excisionase family DNA binding protein
MTEQHKPRLHTGVKAKPRDWLTVDEFCEEMQISRSTFNDWRAKGRGPACIKLPNGQLRIRKIAVDRWLEKCEAAAG